MKAICPNLRNKEVKQQFDELKNTLGEEVAYYVWSYNNGYSLDYAPNGAQSKLFSDLLKQNKGDRKSAIMAKARAYSPSYRKLHVDWLLQSNDEEIYESLDSNSEPFIEDLLKESDTSNVLRQYNSEADRTSKYSTIPVGRDSLAIILKGFSKGDITAKTALKSMLDSDLFYQDPTQRKIAEQLFEKISENIIITLDAHKDDEKVKGYWMVHSTTSGTKQRTIDINTKKLNTENAFDIGRVLLHEILHDFTVDEYNNNKIFASKITEIYTKISKLFPSSKYGRMGLYYGLSSPTEFISEIYTNSAFRDLVAKNNMSYWRKLLYTILNTLNLNKIADKVALATTTSIYNEISDIINEKRFSNYSDIPLGDGLLAYGDTFKDELSRLDKEAHIISEKIIKGLNASYKSLKSRDKSPIVLAKLQQAIDQYELDFQKNDDALIIINFIKRSSEQFKPVLNLIRKAYTDDGILSNDEILNFKNDFLDFYGPMCEEINKKLLLQDYFSNLDENSLNVLRTNMDLINRAYTEIAGKYDRILRRRSAQIITNLGRLYNVPTEEITDYITNDMQKTVGDINFMTLWLRPNANLKDLITRLSYRAITDINNTVQIFANNKAQYLIREFSKIDKSDQLLYFEKDKNGKTTGYLIRDRRYGEFKSDMRKFSQQLDKEYGVVDGNYYGLNEEEFYQYLTKKEEWLEQHCERRFKPEYYKLYNKLKPVTRLKLKSLNGEIQSLIESVTDKSGVHLEKLSDKNWNQLDKLYQIKKNLSNLYTFDGVLKVGEEREIAEDLMNFYDSLGSGKIKSLTMTQEQIKDLIEQKQKELSTEEFEKWKQRNISYSYSDEFFKLIESDMDLGEHQKEYEDLIEQRRMLMQLGRNNNLPRTEAKLLNSTVKERIKELDQQIDTLRHLYSNSKSNFKEYANMVVTPEYNIDKKRAQEAGEEAYKEWYDKSHYVNSRGNETVVSYYRIMVPKDQKHIEIRLSRMNQELDKDSELINPNYDFNNPEYYQPKKSLYDNTKAYNEAIDTKEKKEIYNLIVSTIEEANDKIPFLSKNDKYKLPQITGDIVDFTMRGNKFWRGIAEYTLDSILIKSDDADYAMDNFTQKPDGTELKFIPTHYIKMLNNPEHISRNLVGLLTEYAKMAENYRIKNEKIADFEVLTQQMASRTFEVSHPWKRTTSEKRGDTTNSYHKLIDFIDMQMYGQLEQPLTSNRLGKDKDKQISFSKIIKMINRYASSSNLGWNLAAISKSFLQGIHKSTVEALANRYFDRNTYYRLLAYKIFKLPTILYHLSDPKHNDLTLSLLERSGIARDLNDKIANMQYNRVYRFIAKNIIWGGWSAIDYMIKAPIVEAIYADYKYIPSENKFMSKRAYIREKCNDNWKKGAKEFKNIKSFTLLDVYTVKNGVPVIKDQYKQYEEIINDNNLQNSVINVARFITNRIDGILSSEDKTKFMTNAFGASVMMHRSFFINNMEDNILAEYQYNPNIEDYYEAKYRSTYKVLWNWMSNLYFNMVGIDSSLKKNDSIQIYNFKRTMIQLTLIGMYTLLVSLWLKPEADKDKKSFIKNFIGYSVAGMTFEEKAEYNPFDLINQIKSPSAAIAPVENVTNIIKLFDPVHWDNEFKEINKGPYKGLERWQRNIIKATPGLRGLYESSDPRSKWEYLESQLDK